MPKSRQMRVFISWSGQTSKAIASALRGWLEIILPVDPWMSAEDIPKGTSWLEKLLTELERADVGIICLTPDNVDAPFILFEAGALAKKRKKSFVCTYLYGEVNTGLPLSIFQHTRAKKKNETLQMLRAINEALGHAKVADNILEKRFSQVWSSLNKAIDRELRQVNKPAERAPRHSLPVKWINVAGSGNNKELFPKEIAELCQKLGRMLAQRDFGLVTAGWPYVDETVTRAYIAERKKLGRPVDEFVRQIIRQDKRQLFPGGRTVLASSEYSVWAHQVEEADACVLVSGEGGALQTGLWFSKHGKPVFPLADSGGDARKFFFAGREYPFQLDRGIDGITKDDYARLGNPLPGVLDDLMSLLDQWVRSTAAK